MPVIVVGADTPSGREILAAVLEPEREVRAFISDPAILDELRDLGVKVALGDVSDASHVSGACLNCFTAVLVVAAASDERERSFASTPAKVLDAWVEAVVEAGVQRVIWVGHEDRPVPQLETATVDPSSADVPGQVASLDDAATL